MKRPVSFDYQSIGQSLKRVKISTSPGELRLDRDVESLISSKDWTSTAQIANTNIWPHQNVNYHGSSTSTPSWERRGSRIHSELLRDYPNARLVRDPVDPLRLTLTCLHQPPMSLSLNNDTTQLSSPLPPEQWTFFIQMPRMYPHVPPVITRVSREFAPNSESMACHIGNRNIHYSPAAAMMATSSLMQSRIEPVPVPEHVLVRLLPTPHSDFNSDNNSDFRCLDIDLATSQMNSWSPVSSLQDLIDFLTQIPARRRSWWRVENNRRLHQQQVHFLRNNAIGNYPVGHPTIAPGHERQHFQSAKQQSFSCDMEDDGNMNVVESMVEDTHHDFSRTSTERRFTPNRFDVGYEKSPKPCRHWGM